MKKSGGKRIINVFLGILLLYMVVSLVLSGFGTYYEQVSIVNRITRNHIRDVAQQIEYEILSDEDDFKEFVDYLLANRNNIDVPIDFDSWDQAKEDFDLAFAEQYPGKVFGSDVMFKDLSEELKTLYTIYNYEYYMLLFEQYTKSFDLPYVYFVRPTGNGQELSYVIDCERLPREDNEKYIVIADTSDEAEYNCVVLWKVWEKGVELDEWDEFDNEYGKTYSYYLPLYLNNSKVGLICVDADVNTVNSEILSSTIRVLGLNAFVMFMSVIAFAALFNRTIVKRIGLLSDKIRSYTNDKDPGIADDIDKSFEGKDEISSLAGFFSDMIRQIDTHIKSITSISDQLAVEKIRAETMNELANTDSLTGLKSRTAYISKEIEFDEMISKNNAPAFGIVLIDLNYLKQINDKYGHEKGDIALINTASLIRKVFGSEDTYRIGGDEFVAIVNNSKDIEKKKKEFNDLMNSDTRIEKWEHISAALGSATYQKGVDTCVADVLSKADTDMYIVKKKMKIRR